MAEVPGAYLEDASGFRGHADALYVPAAADELAAILREAAAGNTPITIAGAGTGVTGGRCPLGGIVVSLEKFQRLEIRGGSAPVGAGVLLRDLHSAAQATGQFYPPDPTEWSASIGGTVATNASGSRSFRYGSTRQWLRALTVATMDGAVRTYRRGERVDFPYTPLPLSRARKQTAGYFLPENVEWVDLFCGSEGTLGVVLEAEVALLPLPAHLLTGTVFFPDEAATLDAVDAWRGVPQLRMLEFFDAASLAFLRRRYADIPREARAALLIEHELDGLPGDPIEDWLDRLETAGALADASWFGEAPADRERFRVFRHALPEIVNDAVRQNGFQKLGSDFAVPVDRNAEMMAFYRARLDQEFPGQSVIFGHVGDAHVHVNLLPRGEDDAARGRALMLEFARHAVALGGTVSAEHGLGKRKADLLSIQYTPEQIKTMKAVKRRLDPQWLLGRGTLLPVDC